MPTAAIAAFVSGGFVFVAALSPVCPSNCVSSSTYRYSRTSKECVPGTCTLRGASCPRDPTAWSRTPSSSHRVKINVVPNGTEDRHLLMHASRLSTHHLVPDGIRSTIMARGTLSGPTPVDASAVYKAKVKSREPSCRSDLLLLSPQRPSQARLEDHGEGQEKCERSSRLLARQPKPTRCKRERQPGSAWSKHR